MVAGVRAAITIRALGAARGGTGALAGPVGCIGAAGGVASTEASTGAACPTTRLAGGGRAWAVAARSASTI